MCLFVSKRIEMTPLLAPEMPIITRIRNDLKDRCMYIYFECKNYDSIETQAKLTVYTEDKHSIVISCVKYE